MDEKKNAAKRPAKAKKPVGSCDSCEFFDYDEQTDSCTCCLSLDEDEFASFAAGNTKGCPYYRFYDEYKSVQKQN